MDIKLATVEQKVATGRFPHTTDAERVARECYEQTLPMTQGEVADYIPELAKADPDLFGIAATRADGEHYSVGDADVHFSIQSISKAFVYALARDALGHGVIRDAVGVNNTGLPFNSVMAIELNDGHPMNSMVNAGAITTTAMIPGDTAEDQWAFILRGLSAFAGRELEVDDAVYGSESAHNQHNHALSRLLESYGQLHRDPQESVDIYTRQCSIAVNTSDLAVMGSTLANGGVNPITKEVVVDASVCNDVLAIMATTGMYQRSGEWLYEIGLPAKSGVSGGIVAVAPGKGAIATFSPRLDSAGNSVRGIYATSYLSRALGLNLFASEPYVD